jgi:hypothetical protein
LIKIEGFLVPGDLFHFEDADVAVVCLKGLCVINIKNK